MTQDTVRHGAPPRQMTGLRHRDGRCNCGCSYVVGLVGTLDRDDEAPLRHSLGFAHYTFQVDLGTGVARSKTVAYTLAEIR